MREMLKKMSLLALAGLMATWLVSCGQSDESGNGESEEQGQTEDDSAMTEGTDLAAQKAAYPIDTCVVGGDKLGMMGEPVQHIHEGRLVQFCCKDCVGEFEKDSAKYLAMLDKAKDEKEAK